MHSLIRATIITLCLLGIAYPAHAAKQAKSAKATKEKLVLMPLRVAEEDKSLQGAMETALVQGLQQKYEVFSGERVAQKAREIFNKESRNTAKKECDETRCMQGIAEGFQAELIATANVTKRDDGYFLALSVQNIFENLVVYSNSSPCKNCDAFQVVEKLKEMVGAPAPVAVVSVVEAPQPKVNLNDSDGVLWAEAQKSNAVEDYQVYLDSYPKGKYAPFAKARIKKIKGAAQAAAEQQEQQAWDTAHQENSEASYDLYLKAYPTGRFVGLAKVRSNKLKNDLGAREEAALWQTVQASEDGKLVQNFLAKYPGSSHLAAAQQRLAVIKKAEAEMKPGKVFKDCPDCPEMVIIPAGSFDMGSPSSETGRFDHENPVHRVSIGKPFAIGKTHITKSQFMAFVNETNYSTGDKCFEFEDGKLEERSGSWRSPGYPQDGNHPVTCINWNDAKAYVNWLAHKTGKQYRLPSEAEWEYAARAGTTTARYWGDDPDQACGYANVADKTYQAQVSDGSSWRVAHGCIDGYAYTAPVGSFKPNAFGLYDMLGNLWQWVEDSHHDNYNGAPVDGSVWLGGDANRVIRGGSWRGEPGKVRSAMYTGGRPGSRGSFVGFRLARTVP